MSPDTIWQAWLLALFATLKYALIVEYHQGNLGRVRR